jgi:hypothetical protein
MMLDVVPKTEKRFESPVCTKERPETYRATLLKRRMFKLLAQGI